MIWEGVIVGWSGVVIEVVVVVVRKVLSVLFTLKVDGVIDVLLPIFRGFTG